MRDLWNSIVFHKTQNKNTENTSRKSKNKLHIPRLRYNPGTFLRILTFPRNSARSKREYEGKEPKTENHKKKISFSSHN